MSNRARLYPLLTLCTLGCSLPADSGDMAATTDDSSSSTFAEPPSLTDSLISTTLADATTTGDGDDIGAPPAAPGLVLDYAPLKQFMFSWDPVDGADYYQLLERPYPEVPGWSQFGADQFETSLALTMPIHRRLSAAYKLRACNRFGCSESEPVPVGPAVDAAIGYFKASNAESQDNFGHSLAISADGSTMVVGAPYEDSGARGIGGDELHNYAPDSGAAYVFVRDGDTWKQQAYLKSANAEADDQFGAVAISADGDTIAVGAPREASAATGVGGDAKDNSMAAAGAVYVFERTAGVWKQAAYVKASHGRELSQFGEALALSADGHTLAVGAPGEDSAATGVDGDPWQGLAEDSGAVYVYSREGGDWQHRAYLKAANAGAADRFGVDLALSANGATLAVGAPYEASKSAGIDGDMSDDSQSSGAVYVFTAKTGAWSQEAYIKASNPGLGDWFGYSVALTPDGDMLAVGAPAESSAATEIDGDPWNDAAPSAGAVYMFSRLGQTWQQDAYLKTPNAGAGHSFGASVALSADGGVLAAGAATQDGGGVGSFPASAGASAPESGAAYVFSRVAGTWKHQRYLKAPNSRHDIHFGESIGLTSDAGTLVIGAPLEDSAATGVGGDLHDASGSRVGAVYMY